MSAEHPSTNPVLDLVEAQTARALDVYRVDPGLVEEHANNERRIEQGGYGDRQIFELVQNAADELRGQPGGEISVVLTEQTLYCANEGEPVTPQGADTILRMSVSKKRGGQIGRFGVGVKSVLAICDAPQFFSTSDGDLFAFGFDRAWSAARIRSVQPDAERTPVLRMARALDVDEERTDDGVLDELLTWATTVVRLPLRQGLHDRLAHDLRTFPVEFPLFSPHVGTVTLLDRRRAPVKRQFFLRRSGVDHVIEEERPEGNTVQHHWRVFTRAHRPGQDALATAGELHDRPTVDVSWAVPRSAQARGLFWSYFPTKFATLLRGILNAPWKTSEDRQAIFDGNAFNEELIGVAADLVVDSLEHLVNDDEPGGYLAFLPGRGREAPQFADERLTAAIWRVAGQKPSVLDQEGRLRRPSDVRLHPDNLDRELLDIWAAAPGRPSAWVHPALEARERRSRVEQIFAAAGRAAASVEEWLEALVESREPTCSAAAVRIAASLARGEHEYASRALRAKIVLTELGELVAPRPGTVFQRSGAESLADDIVYVHPDVLQEFGIHSALATLGINEADADGRLSAAADRGFAGYDTQAWEAFWDLTREAGPSGTVEVLKARPRALAELRARVVAGQFRPLREILRPGRVVPADGSRDKVIALDTTFHASDLTVLSSLGLLEVPAPSVDPSGEEWFEDYREAAWQAFMRSLPSDARRPQLATMKVEGTPTAGPLRLLPRLSDEGRAAFIKHLPAAGLVQNWSVQVGRQQQTRKQFRSPLAWMAVKHGRLDTSHGLRPVIESVGPALNEYRDVLPVADVGNLVADVIRLPSEVAKIPPAVWRAALNRLPHVDQDEAPVRLYALLLREGGTWPEDIATWCRVGNRWAQHRDEEIAVTSSREDYDELRRSETPALLAPTDEDVALLIEEWGMQRGGDLVTKELRTVPQAAPEVILDLFPALKIKKSRVEGWSVQRCSVLERLVHSPQGVRSEPLERASQGQTVLVAEPEDDLATLRAVDAELSLGLGLPQCRIIIDNQRKQARSRKIQDIRRTSSVPEKVVRLLGEDVLRARLPAGLEAAERRRKGRPLTPVEVGQLAIDAHGPELLREHADEVATRADNAPRTYVGAESARRFVADLGLPDNFAGASIPAPPVVETVSGPTMYPALHEYQETLASRMRDLLLEPVPRRALLRLPTGAGKTRVAVEAMIRVVKAAPLRGPILWIAESNELCEQAVQSWKFVWSKVGPEEQLTISRFWGGNDVVAVNDTTHLVVATDATLDQRLGNEDLAWLCRPSVVIVDEAHRGTTPRYTRIFEKLGLSLQARRTDRPLIGLTATPFRGRNEAETKNLVERFGGTRLDDGLFGEEEAAVALQRLGVLARVEHRRLKGSTLTLSDDQSAQAKQLGSLPASAEAQLGLDEVRNDTLLREIVGLPADWSVLVFAVSVEHAKFLAASLNARRIPAASISGATPPGQRRQTIESYRRGKVRVLTNYGVLAQGFDAPATRAVVVARPTFSPNVYQQMIGRGLRGPQNGGSTDCLILDVEDNIENFDGQLAWSGFEYLWSGGR
ncbi:sacsin N-terminal ATP-binding-like domain-containing protein [Actinomycetospora sp. CA-084318]|uniref:sacsin N-terminal ATP-binding-like domain-containing protein n=1 Tax=Actinomycetospora sp. CA-084318 TaxID=3239892 RepID=UPI003D996B60